MKIVLFDLGDTLEAQGALVPEAIETLEALNALLDGVGRAPVLALISDFKDAATPEQKEAFRAEYLQIVEGLGIARFFQPADTRMTISTEIGVRKPDERLFRLAVDKVQPGLPWKDVAFITENMEHIAAARLLGMKGICVKGGANPTVWDVEFLSGIVPLLDAWLKS
jgi:FMN phosphatase YigB (HAD superfamily)